MKDDLKGIFAVTGLFFAAFLAAIPFVSGCGVQEPAPPSSVDHAAAPDLGSAAVADLTVSCKSSAECDDDNPCTADVCAVDNGASSCVHKAIAGCTADLPDLSTPPDLTPKPLICPQWRLDCDGNPANGCETVFDDNNCGSCGNVCGAVPNGRSECFINVCGIGGNCNRDYADCDLQVANGCERNLTNDPANCGTCGKTCGQGETCQAGQCQMLPITASCRWSLKLADPDEKMVRLAMGIAVNNGPMLKVEETFNPNNVATPELVITGKQGGLKSGDRLEVSVEYETNKNRSWSCLGQGNAGRQVGTLECTLSNGGAKMDAWAPVPNGIGGCNIAARVP